jgi:hypothetical protein
MARPDFRKAGWIIAAAVHLGMHRIRTWLQAWWPGSEAGREIVETLLWTRVGLLLAGWVALALLPWQYLSPTFNTSSSPWILMWVRWDGIWYTQIAQHGYWTQALAFFPLYPLLIAVGHFVFRLGYDASAVVVANVSLLLFVFTLYHLVRETFDDTLARRAVWLVLIFPSAFFLSAAYTESLFLWLSTATFLALKRRRFVAAGIFGMLATLTRNEGLFLALAFFVVYYRDFGWRWRWQILGVLPIGLGLAAFMTYQWIDFGTPLAFMQAQAYWGRHITWPVLGFFWAVRTIWNGSPLQPNAVLSMIDLLAAISAGLLWIYGLKHRLPWDWLVYWAVLWLVDVSAPVASGESPLLSMSRLVLVIFPMFVTLAMLAERESWRRFLGFVLPMLQVVFFVTFATWHWIA